VDGSAVHASSRRMQAARRIKRGLNAWAAKPPTLHTAEKKSAGGRDDPSHRARRLDGNV